MPCDHLLGCAEYCNPAEGQSWMSKAAKQNRRVDVNEVQRLVTALTPRPDCASFSFGPHISLLSEKISTINLNPSEQKKLKSEHEGLRQVKLSQRFPFRTCLLPEICISHMSKNGIQTQWDPTPVILSSLNDLTIFQPAEFSGRGIHFVHDIKNRISQLGCTAIYRRGYNCEYCKESKLCNRPERDVGVMYEHWFPKNLMTTRIWRFKLPHLWWDTVWATNQQEWFEANVALNKRWRSWPAKGTTFVDRNAILTS